MSSIEDDCSNELMQLVSGIINDKSGGSVDCKRATQILQELLESLDTGIPDIMSRLALLMVQHPQEMSRGISVSLWRASSLRGI